MVYRTFASAKVTLVHTMIWTLAWNGLLGVLLPMKDKAIKSSKRGRIDECPVLTTNPPADNNAAAIGFNWSFGCHLLPR